MTYYTQPDLLPVPDDGSQPALALPTLRALADATQAALAVCIRRAANGWIMANGPIRLQGAQQDVYTWLMASMTSVGQRALSVHWVEGALAPILCAPSSDPNAAATVGQVPSLVPSPVTSGSVVVDSSANPCTINVGRPVNTILVANGNPQVQTGWVIGAVHDGGGTVRVWHQGFHGGDIQLNWIATV
jgi:hypothetical protein